MASGNQKGQILLVVILVIIVASTIGLSLASRTITSLRTSTEEAESQKALAAAEAGIESAIQANIPINIPLTNLSNNSNYVTTVFPVQSTSFLINGGNLISKDEGADVWFVGHKSDGSIDYVYPLISPSSINLYWGSSGEDCSANKPAAVQAIVVTRSSLGAISSYRYAYDSCSRGNNFTLASSGTFPLVDNGVTYNFKYRTPANDLANGIAIPKNIILIRIVPIYKDAVIGISSDVSLPTQGYLVSATGVSGQANRRIKFFKGWPQTYLPYLSYGLFVAN